MVPCAAVLEVCTTTIMGRERLASPDASLSQPTSWIFCAAGATVLTLERPILGLSLGFGVGKGPQGKSTTCMSCNMTLRPSIFGPSRWVSANTQSKEGEKRGYAENVSYHSIGNLARAKSRRRIPQRSFCPAFAPSPSSCCSVVYVVRRHDASRVHKLIEDCQP